MLTNPTTMNTARLRAIAQAHDARAWQYPPGSEEFYNHLQAAAELRQLAHQHESQQRHADTEQSDGNSRTRLGGIPSRKP